MVCQELCVHHSGHFYFVAAISGHLQITEQASVCDGAFPETAAEIFNGILQPLLLLVQFEQFIPQKNE